MAKHERETESDNFNYLSVIHFSDFLFNMSRKEKLYFYWVKRRLKMKEACLKKKKEHVEIAANLLLLLLPFVRSTITCTHRAD